MEILNIKVILLLMNMKEMENVIMKMVNIIYVNSWMVNLMEKEYYIIKLEILNIYLILLMVIINEIYYLLTKIAITKLY